VVRITLGYIIYVPYVYLVKLIYFIFFFDATDYGEIKMNILSSVVHSLSVFCLPYFGE